MVQPAPGFLADLVQALLGEPDDVELVDDDRPSRKVSASQVVIGAPPVGDDHLGTIAL